MSRRFIAHRIKDRIESKGIVNGKSITAYYRQWKDRHNYVTSDIFPYRFEYGNKFYGSEYDLRGAIIQDRSNNYRNSIPEDV